MASQKRRGDVFTAAFPLWEGVVRLVTSLACPSCEMQVYDLREGCATDKCREKAARYEVTAVLTVLVNGTLLECSRRGPIDADVLWAAGGGQV
jgi:hypothetical protein